MTVQKLTIEEFEAITNLENYINAIVFEANKRLEKRLNDFSDRICLDSAQFRFDIYKNEKGIK